MSTVGIGPNFFKKSLNDYRDWLWALPREAMQNSMDAPNSKNITTWTECKDGNTSFMWENDGDPMNKEELVGKLLTLGESGKDFQGTVGGFGAAKLILLFCHLNYEILTGNLRVVGSGGNYSLEEREIRYPGTLTRITIEGDYTNSIIANLRAFLSMSQWRGHVSINGENYNCRLNKGTKRDEFEWCTVYTNRTIQNRMVVRINGIPMFYRHVDSNRRCIVVELKSGNSEVLQSNRDALKWEYQGQLDAFVDSITINKLSALRNDEPRYIHYSGDKLFSNQQERANETMMKIFADAYATVPFVIGVDRAVENAVVDEAVLLTPVKTAQVHEISKQSKLKHEFVIKNNTGMEIPIHYLPSDFSEYSQKLTTIWTKVLLKLHEIFKHKATFSVGFILDDDSAAEFECNREYGDVYYVSPITIVKQKESGSRSMAKRRKFNAAGRWAIVADALHEFVHGAIGLSGHDELYSSTLTEMMGVVLKEHQQFNKCFV
jgi:hypothetical protein